MSDFVSNGWALFVGGIVIAGMVYCFFVLLGAARHKVVYDAKGNVDKTTGHVWDDDLQELNNPLPRWWMGLFLITLFFGMAYFWMYPGLGFSEGSLKWTQYGQYEKEIQAAKVKEDEVYARFKPMSVEALARDPEAHAIGERLFLNNCAACHGSDAKGAKGFPNLTDDDWLHGGSPDKIIETIAEGRQGQMPVMAPAVGSADEVKQVANYVLSLSNSAHNPVLAQLGKAKFTVCAACHGADGKGNQAVGAPNLTDKIWLHGWGEAAVLEMVNKGKLNVMPAQKTRYTAEQIKVLAAYVWGFSHPTQTAAK